MLLLVLKKIKSQKLKKVLRKSQHNIQHYLKKLKFRQKNDFLIKKNVYKIYNMRSIFCKSSIFQIQFCSRMLPVCVILIKIESILNRSHFHNFWLSFSLTFQCWNIQRNQIIKEFVEFAILIVNSVAKYQIEKAVQQ